MLAEEVGVAIAGPLKLNVQITRDGQPAIGPGKALVMEAVARTGSISAAGRDLGMSYRRIWLLVDDLNGSWAERVVETRAGGGTAGGAKLTAFGEQLLAVYREVEASMVAAAQGERLDWLVAALRDMPDAEGVD
ncbi:winged helix-turn-helix domain-containing protein [Sphingomonas bacterium]|uniref:winged helix-turn-helix domain-containing protein n=1 Tax=Sphingomonas bacterium TaxID=1895847 RepID=UPI001576F1D4|nr:LysR family transcriptional regulator [Sphingomonas bacterium]